MVLDWETDAWNVQFLRTMTSYSTHLSQSFDIFGCTSCMSTCTTWRINNKSSTNKSLLLLPLCDLILNDFFVLFPINRRCFQIQILNKCQSFLSVNRFHACIAIFEILGSLPHHRTNNKYSFTNFSNNVPPSLQPNFVRVFLAISDQLFFFRRINFQ